MAYATSWRYCNSGLSVLPYWIRGIRFADFGYRVVVLYIEAASEYENMSKEQLIQELMKSKVREARLKKGYMVKGVGANKEFVPLNNKSIK